MIRRATAYLGQKKTICIYSKTDITRIALLAILSDMSATAIYANRHMC
jgi:hypothetical protein